MFQKRDYLLFLESVLDDEYTLNKFLLKVIKQNEILFEHVDKDYILKWGDKTSTKQVEVHEKKEMSKDIKNWNKLRRRLDTLIKFYNKPKNEKERCQIRNELRRYFKKEFDK